MRNTPNLATLERRLQGLLTHIKEARRAGGLSPRTSNRASKPVKRRNWIHDKVAEAVTNIPDDQFTIRQVEKVLSRHKSEFAPATVRTHLEDMVGDRKLRVIVRGRGRRATVFRKAAA
jgi:hypothetical protein